MMLSWNGKPKTTSTTRYLSMQLEMRDCPRPFKLDDVDA